MMRGFGEFWVWMGWMGCLLDEVRVRFLWVLSLLLGLYWWMLMVWRASLGMGLVATVACGVVI